MQVRLRADSEQQTQLQTRNDEADTAEHPILPVPSKRSLGGSSAERTKKPRTAAQLAYTSYVRKLL